jgi:hypothetical protein
MAIDLNEPARANAPVIRHSRIGELAQLAIVRTEQRDRKTTNQLTNQLERIPNGFRPDGTPKFKQELVIHCLSLPGGDMTVKQGEDFIVPAPGSRVRVILKGKGFGDWIEARKSHRNGNLSVGDLLILSTQWAQKYDQSGAPKGGKITAQADVDAIPRGVTVGLYGPIELAPGADPAWITKAEDEYIADKKSEQAAKAIPAAAPLSWLDDSEEAPF